MLKAYKYRIYPNKEQEEFFAKTFGCCRFVWNKMLNEKLSAYAEKKPIPLVTPAKYKKDFPFLREVDSLALAYVQLQLEKAFKNHFKNPKSFGLPQLKRKKYKQSYTTNLYLVGLERPEVKPVEHALVDDRIPYGIPKKPSCWETGSQTFCKAG